MTKAKHPAPPAHLSTRGRRLWRELHASYVLDDPVALELLRRLCEASDTADQAREQLAEDGLTVTTRFGEVRAHPCAAIERDARTAVARLARELRISEPPEDDRPPRQGRRS